MKPTTNMIIELAMTRVTRVYSRHFLTSSSGREFMAKFIPAVQKSSTIREEYEKREKLFIPTFLLASISKEGSGPYQCMEDNDDAAAMTPEEWRAFFAEIASIGVLAVLFALGEPLLNPECLKVAAEFPNLLFGAVCDPRYFNDELIDFFANNQNIIPLLTVDCKKGDDLEQVKAMYMVICEKLRKKRVPFGNAFITTRENIDLVCDFKFAELLKYYGSHFFCYMNYVHLRDGYEKLEPTASQRQRLHDYVEEVKTVFTDCVTMLTPDDLYDLGGEDMPNLGYFIIKSNGSIETLMKNREFTDLSVKGIPLMNSFKTFYVIDPDVDSGFKLEEIVSYSYSSPLSSYQQTIDS